MAVLELRLRNDITRERTRDRLQTVACGLRTGYGRDGLITNAIYSGRNDHGRLGRNDRTSTCGATECGRIVVEVSRSEEPEGDRSRLRGGCKASRAGGSAAGSSEVFATTMLVLMAELPTPTGTTYRKRTCHRYTSSPEVGSGFCTKRGIGKAESTVRPRPRRECWWRRTERSLATAVPVTPTCGVPPTADWR